MSFNVTYTRFKNFVNGGSFLPGDMNSIQDDLGVQLALANVQAGVNEGPNVRRGKFLQPAAGTRANATYGALTNGPDQVANLVVPTDGLIWFLYQAIWQETVAGAARAGVFIDGNQLKYTPVPTGSVLDANMTGGPNVDCALGTSSTYGILSGSADPANAEQTTGFVAGGNSGTNGSAGACVIWVPAGTHTVSVQFKASSGTVTVKNRRMWVRTESFG